jgi:DNA-binding PadR family transcriptional regulator
MAGTTLSPLAAKALGTLHQRPMHPYELYQVMFRRREDRVVKLRPGTLYHAIAKLADSGLIEAVGTDRGGNRPERTTYQVTARGRQVFTEQLRATLAEPTYEYPEFPVAIGSALTLPKDEVLEVIRRRRDTLQAELDLTGQGLAIMDERAIPEVYRLDVDYQHALVRFEIDWLTRLIDRIDSGDLDWDQRDHVELDEGCFHIPTPLHPTLPPPVRQPRPSDGSPTDRNREGRHRD